MRIVVVEDEAPIREGMSRLLSKISDKYELVGKAENGEKGLAIIRKEQPDLVILDIKMPDMDGLTMLAKIREEGIPCKAVVLSAYSEFDYAKTAIDLDVEAYLLKPIKVSEFEKVLGQIEQVVQEEQIKKDIVDMDHIFLDAVTGRLDSAGRMVKIIENRYGIKPDEELVIVGFGLESKFEQYHTLTKTMIEAMTSRSKGFQAHISEFPGRAAIVMILWQIEDESKIQSCFERKIIPVLSGQIQDGVACIWAKCNGFANIRMAIEEMKMGSKWNLLFEKGKIISTQSINERATAPFKYPYEIEERAYAALMNGNKEEFLNTLESLRKYCMSHPGTPEDLQSVLTKGLLRFYHTARETGKIRAEESAQMMVNRLVNANTWEEITALFQTFFDKLSFETEEEINSILVQKARRQIEEYYNQGITLEEIAEKLHVSEEYLSAQFRKETGKTFSETIRRHRLEHIKELLLNSTLKMNQIADMVGYTDAKYMSRVFKEEVGMLPTDYRKINS